jgi:hypothetical protein
MFSFGSLVCEDTDGGAEGEGRSVTLKMLAYPKDALFWWLCLLFQVGLYVALGIHIRQVGWDIWRAPQPYGPEEGYWLLYCSVPLTAYVTTLAALPYAEERSSRVSSVHPRLHRVLTLRWAEATYREGAEVSPSAVVDGRELVAGDLLGVATGRAYPIRRIHLVFRDAAVELNAVFGGDGAGIDAFARELASRLRCSVAAEVPFSATSSLAYRLLTLPWTVALLSAVLGFVLTLGHLPAGLWSLLVNLGLNLVLATWGARQLVKARSAGHRRFMTNLRFVPTSNGSCSVAF